MRVLEACDRLDFALKALGAERPRQFRMQHFERHWPLVAEVLGQVNRGHAAASELVLDAVTVG